MLLDWDTWVRILVDLLEFQLSHLGISSISLPVISTTNQTVVARAKKLIFFHLGLLHGTKSPHHNPADVGPDLVAILILDLDASHRGHFNAMLLVITIIHSP